MTADGHHSSPLEHLRHLTLQNIRQMECSVTLADPSLPDCPLIGCSEGFERITGYSRKEVLGRNCRFLSQGCNVEPHVRAALRTAAATGGDFVGLLANRRKSGEEFQNFLRMTSITVAGHRYILGIQADVTHVRMNLQDEEQAAEVKKVAQRVFAENIDAWVKIQAQEFQRQLPVTYNEVIGDLLNSSQGEACTHNLHKFAKVVATLLHGDLGSMKSEAARRPSMPEKALSHGKGDENVACDGSTPTKAQAEPELALAARQVLYCKNTFIHVLDEDAQGEVLGMKRSASDSCLERTSAGSADIAVDPDMISTTSSEGRGSPMKGSTGNTTPSSPQEQAVDDTDECVEKGLKASRTRRRRRRAAKNAKNRETSEPFRPPVEPVEAVMIKTNSVVKGVSWAASAARCKEASSHLTFATNQKVHLPVHLDTEGLGAAERDVLISGLSFSVSPPLPKGFSMDVETGTISGASAEVQERTEHIVTVSTCAKGPGGIYLGSVPLVREKLSLRVEDIMHRYRVCEVLEERDEFGNVRLVVRYEAEN